MYFVSAVLLPTEAPQLLVWVFLTLSVVPFLGTSVHVPWNVLRTTMRHLSDTCSCQVPGTHSLYIVPTSVPTIMPGEDDVIHILPSGDRVLKSRLHRWTAGRWRSRQTVVLVTLHFW